MYDYLSKKVALASEGQSRHPPGGGGSGVALGDEKVMLLPLASGQPSGHGLDWLSVFPA
jgi:hypothetical protein